LFSTIFDISEPIFSFLSIFSKPFLESSSIDKGETANGSGFKFPRVISTSIKAFTLIGININKSPYIKNCPTTNLNELTNKHVKINEIEKSLKQIFENNLLKMYNLKVNN